MPTHKKPSKKKKATPARATKSATKKKQKAVTRKPARKQSANKTVTRPARKKTLRRTTERRPELEVARMQKGPGPGRSGQSGDVQDLPEDESVDTESVEELSEEGQDFEASFVEGVEKAADHDEEEVTTEESPEDDVPPEYIENE